ncbi:MAG: hypothetical protein SFZ23_01910 [Planctomycetota bacterium]|nr:hypothetical protein [Planctomycetota bacterium]
MVTLGSPRARRAAVLVDVIVATILLGVALTTMLRLSGRAATDQARGERVQVAAMLADEQLNLVLMRGPDDYAARFPLEGVCEEPFQDFRFRLDFSGSSSTSSPASRSASGGSSGGGGLGGQPYVVSATILWNDFAGQERSISVETMIAPRLGEDTDPIRTPDAPAERVE